MGRLYDQWESSKECCYLNMTEHNWSTVITTNIWLNLIEFNRDHVN